MHDLLHWLQINQLRALGGFFAALCAAAALTPLVMQVTRTRGLVAQPCAERWHKAPTALFGGVAIMLATALAFALFLPDKYQFWGVGGGALFIFAVGLYDDYRALGPVTKFVAQLVAACFFVSFFFSRVEKPDLAWLVPFAILWIVGVTNAFNLLDNMDGLSSGVAAIIGVMLACHAALAGDTNVALGALIVAGAAGGFLIFNFHPARIFMGDCGSMFLGFSLACLSLMGRHGLITGNLFTALLMPTLVLATPLFDTTFVSLVRVLHGRSIAQGGRDHTSHRLVLLGLSERRAVCWLYGITLWFGLIALWGASVRNLLATVAITLMSVIALLVFGLFLAEVQTYSEEEYERARNKRFGDKTVLSRVVMHKRRFIEALLDFGLVCACFIAAYLLKFDGQLGGQGRTLGIQLPYVAACQMIAFFAAGLYRGLWRYVTISDLGAAVRGVVYGALGSYVLIWLLAPVGQFSRSVFIIYAVLLLIAVSGARIGLKVLRYHFAVKWREGVRRVLVVGAGDAGELAVREMFNNQALQLQPIGFLDDDPIKQRASIHGVRVLGARHDLLNVVDKLSVDEVVIAMPSIGNGVVQEIIEACEQNDICYREMRGVIL